MKSVWWKCQIRSRNQIWTFYWTWTKYVEYWILSALNHVSEIILEICAFDILVKKLENSELFILFSPSDPNAVSSNGGDEYVSQRKRWCKKIWRRNMWWNNQLPDILLKSYDQTSFFKNLKIAIQFHRNMAKRKYNIHLSLCAFEIQSWQSERFERRDASTQNLSNLSLE